MLEKENYYALKTIPIFEKVSFEFSDGWFKLIFDLGRKITDYCNDNKIDYPKVQQIKEKFGTLRFYYYDANKDEHIRKWVSAAEQASETICEKCGEAGSLIVTTGIFQTRCKEHSTKDSITSDEYRERFDKGTLPTRKCQLCDSTDTQVYIYEKSFVPRCKDHHSGLKQFHFYLDTGKFE